MGDVMPLILFLLKLVLAIIILGIPLLVIIIFISKYIYEKFINPLYEKYQKDRETK